jgi:xanthine dehydrogenase accessory factor
MKNRPASADTLREILETVYPRYASGETLALATVVSTVRSAPRGPGAAMAVAQDGGVVGSLSGGCVEGAVYDAAVEVRESGRPRLQTYGFTGGDLEAFEVGLTCGGVIEVYIERISRASFPELAALRESLAAGEPVALSTVVAGPEEGPGMIGSRLVVWEDRRAGTFGSAALDDIAAADARARIRRGSTDLRHYSSAGRREGEEVSVFTQSFVAAPRMLVFGAVDYAAAVARLGAFLGYRVTVCDARPVFVTPERFPDADEVVRRWPHEYLEEEHAAGRLDDRTVVAVLTHDPKFDVPLLTAALRMPHLSFVGALGSRRTHEDRLARLREAGLGEAELRRLHSPLGLDLGGRSPEETAVSIAAEIVAEAHGGSGMRLHDTDGPVHANKRGLAAVDSG